MLCCTTGAISSFSPSPSHCPSLPLSLTLLPSLSHPPSLRFGASILVDMLTSLATFDRLLFNPQCFALYEDPVTPPSMWTDVSTHIQIAN